MNNKEFEYDKRQNKRYFYLVFVTAFLGIILSFSLLGFIIDYIAYFFNNKKLTELSIYIYIILLIFLIIFIVNIFIIRRMKLSQVKYYVFKLNKKINIDKVGYELLILKNRKIVIDDVSLRWIKFRKKDFLSYRLLCYKKETFDKKEFDKLKGNIHRKYNKKYNIVYDSRYVFSSKKNLENDIRVNLILPKSINEQLDDYMSLHATGVFSGIISVYITVIDDTMYVQPIKKFIFNLSYFRTIEKVYNYLNSLCE